MRTGTAKQPFCFEVNDGELFALAGLWDDWKDAEGQWIKTCAILTTTPNTVTSTVHDRMPVVLDRESYDLWLDPGMTNVQVVSELLKPYDTRMMHAYLSRFFDRKPCLHPTLLSLWIVRHVLISHRRQFTGSV